MICILFVEIFLYMSSAICNLFLHQRELKINRMLKLKLKNYLEEIAELLHEQIGIDE